jgi:hypothetical protein
MRLDLCTIQTMIEPIGYATRKSHSGRFINVCSIIDDQLFRVTGPGLGTSRCEFAAASDSSDGSIGLQPRDGSIRLVNKGVRLCSTHTRFGLNILRDWP